MAMSVLLLLALSPVLLPPGPVAGPLLLLLLLVLLPPDLSLSYFQEMVMAMKTSLLVFTSCPKGSPGFKNEG